MAPSLGQYILRAVRSVFTVETKLSMPRGTRRCLTGSSGRRRRDRHTHTHTPPSQSPKAKTAIYVSAAGATLAPQNIERPIALPLSGRPAFGVCVITPWGLRIRGQANLGGNGCGCRLSMVEPFCALTKRLSSRPNCIASVSTRGTAGSEWESSRIAGLAAADEATALPPTADAVMRLNPEPPSPRPTPRISTRVLQNHPGFDPAILLEGVIETGSVFAMPSSLQCLQRKHGLACLAPESGFVAAQSV
ncbi:hypothetical protein ABIE49_000043 [Bradyrhizobium sp. OAE829]